VRRATEGRERKSENATTRWCAIGDHKDDKEKTKGKPRIYMDPTKMTNIPNIGLSLGSGKAPPGAVSADQGRRMLSTPDS
jgi:hypothetical protein